MGKHKQPEQKQNLNQKSKPTNAAETNGMEKWFTAIIVAIITALGGIIAAYLIATKPATLTIEATQTAEVFHTTIAMTQTSKALETFVAMTQTASELETSIAMTQTVEALETSIAMAKTAEAIETTIAVTQTAEALRTTIAMTNQAAKPPTNTPLPPSSYGGLTYGCIPTTYWLVDAHTNSETGKCWDLSKSGLLSDNQLLKIFIDNSNVTEKTLSMNISDFKDVDISFSLVVKDMRGNSDTIAPKLAIGICEPARFRYEHAFIYYDLSDNKLASAITLNDFEKKDLYYFYKNEVRNYRLELRSYDLTIYSNNIPLRAPLTVKRTDSTSFCLYYVLPEGGALNAVVDKIQIEEK